MRSVTRHPNPQLHLACNRKFTGKPPAERGTLQHMAIEPKVVSISTGQSAEKAGRRSNAYDRHPIISGLQVVVSKHLQERVHALFDSADDALFELADKAETNTVQSMYFDSMRLVRIQRNEIETRFGENVAEAFHSFLLTGSQVEDSGLHAAISLDDMALVDETDLEENLAITGLVGKVNNRFAQQLYAIEQRLAELMPAISVDAENNPFGPKLMCDAFRSALQNLECELKIKLIVYKLFDKHVVSQLGGMYDEVNRRFVSAGILPQLKMTIKKMPGSTGGGGVDTEAESSFLSSETDTSGNAMQTGGGGDVMQGLQQLLAAARGPAGTGVGTGIPSGDGAVGGSFAGGAAGLAAGTDFGGGLVQASSADVVNALSSLQTGGGLANAEGAAQLNAAQLKAVLLEEHQRAAGHTGGAKINTVDNDVIDIVSMMFDYILEDPNLPVAAKALIGRLQIPMVKVAILDKSFFAKKSHPARSLLNELAQAGIGLDDDGAIEESERFAVLKSIVERILSNFSDDIEIFTELQAELAAHLAAEAEQAQAVETATLQDGRQREHLQLAKTWVAEVIREHLEGKRVPEVVIEIVKGPWKDVLLDTYLNEGQESRLWKEQIRFIDILVWSVEPKQSAMDRQKLAGVILQLLETFRHGLESINYSEEELHRTIELLEPIHLASFRGKESPDPNEAPNADRSKPADPKTLEMELDDVQGVLDEATALLDASLEEDNVTEAAPEESTFLEVDGEQIEDIILSGFDAVDPSQEEDAPDDEYLRLARVLEAGKWVEFTGDGGKTQRAKLAWKSELLNECTFLDWKFKVVTDTTIQGLAADLRRGTARVIDDVPLFERAMDAVVSGLRTRQNSG